MAQNEDDDIARAIALSLMDPKESEIIEILSDTEDEVEIIVPTSSTSKRPPPIEIEDDEARFSNELQRAIEASKKVPNPATSSQPEASTSTDAQKSSFISERAALEKARLERQKRLMGESFFEDDRPSKKSSSPSNGKAPVETTNNTATGSSSSSNGFFWDGELRQVVNVHARDNTKVFRLTDILGDTKQLTHAIISTYALSLSWIYACFPPTLPVTLVAHPPEDVRGKAAVKEILPNWIRVTPTLRPFGCMHMKFMLLFYKTGRLRVVISTANLVEYDWQDMENTAFVQDIPRLPHPSSEKTKNTFATTLHHVLKSLYVAPAVKSHTSSSDAFPLTALSDLLTHWNWDKVKVKLIASLAGKHEGWSDVLKVGHTGMMKMIRELGARCPDGKEVLMECQGSSIGTYTSHWLNEIYASASGASPEAWLDQPKSKRTKISPPPVQIVFPTLRTVGESTLGPQGGGTIFCQKKQWDGANFPRRLFYDANSKRGPILMHAKIIIATFRERGKGSIELYRSLKGSKDNDAKDGIDENVGGWCYVGSHNFTPSAWGNLSGTGFNPSMSINNYEIGILFPLPSKDTQKAADDVACWVRPPRRYELGVDVPWMQNEYGSED